MGRHEAGRRMFPVLFMAAMAVTVAALVLAGTLLIRQSGNIVFPGVVPGAQCGRALTVVTSSSFAPVLAALEDRLSRGADCVDLRIQPVDGRAAAGRLAEAGADVWIPDDTAWAAGASGVKLAAEGVVDAGTIIATSPIFMVTDRATGDRLASVGSSWLGLAQMLENGSGIRLVVRDPAGSGDGLVGAGSVGEAVWLAKGMDASSLSLANVLRATHTVTDRSVALPSGPGDVGLVPEYALVATLSRLDRGTVFLPGTDHTALLRFTWLPTAAAAADPEREAPLRRLLDSLTGSGAASVLAAAGLRGPTADLAPAAAGDRLPAVSAKPFDVLAKHHVDHVFATWYAQDRRTNLLIVVDVSGSIGNPAPGTGTPLIDLIRQGCRSIGGLLPDEATLGLWEFGTLLDPPRDYRALLPIAPLNAGQRQAFGAAVNGLAARRTGTGLYDTMLAAYLTVRDSYRPAMPNQVLLFTDGRNESDSLSISLADLTTRLSQAKDPNRPVQLGIVSFGQDVDAAALQAAVKPVGGYVANLHTAAEIAAVFIHVVAGGLHS